MYNVRGRDDGGVFLGMNEILDLKNGFLVLYISES